MARQQSQGGFGNQYSGQPNVNDFNQDQTDDEHARACSYVREQVRAQLGGQVPAWDGPIPGFWDRVDNQQYQGATTNYAQGQPTHDTTRAQFQAQEQFRGPQQGDNRANWNVPAQGMQQISGHQHTQNGMPGPNTEQGQPATGMQQMLGPFGHQHSQNGMSGPNLGHGQPGTGMQQMPGPFGHQHTQNGMPGPNFGQGQPATPVQGRNQHNDSPRQPRSHGYSPQLD